MAVRQYISQHFFRSPTRMAISSFIILVALGTFLLKLPWSTSTGQIRWVDALFTTVSAVSVTGLAVVDTGSYFTFFGQLVVMLLVQVGGVGIMTFSTLFILMAGRRPGIIGGMTIKDTYTQSGEREPLDILRDVLMFTFGIEALGAALLFFRFVQDHSPLQAAYLAVFHAICAFCNAGFSLFATNLMNYRADWFLNLVMAGLIILGGLGFLVYSDIKRSIRAKTPTWVEMSLQSKLVVSSTLILLVVSTCAILWLERNHTLANLPLNQKILASFFEATTARTAGFNTIDQGAMANETLFFVILLMFIGAGAGSTAGGVKITTASVLILLGLSHVKGEDKPHIFHRSISKSSLDKAISTTLLAAIMLIGCAFFLAMSEESNPMIAGGRGKFLDLLFEITSAFGTVGLSTGVTAKLSDLGKIIVSVMMSIGKLGPLSLALAISYRKVRKFSYSEENIMVG
jgi:trk system potassium uptake protein TrkH